MRYSRMEMFLGMNIERKSQTTSGTMRLRKMFGSTACALLLSSLLMPSTSAFAQTTDQLLAGDSIRVSFPGGRQNFDPMSMAYSRLLEKALKIAPPVEVLVRVQSVIQLQPSGSSLIQISPMSSNTVPQEEISCSMLEEQFWVGSVWL